MKHFSSRSSRGIRLPFIGAFAVFAQVVDLQAAFHGDPPNEHHPWALRDENRPQPPVVIPGAKVGEAPSDALVLFDGTEASLRNWKHEKPDNKRTLDWLVEDGILMCQPGAGYLMSKEEFGDCQLHVEWKAPKNVQGKSQGRGNSGVFLMGIEVQVLDSYENPTYADGAAGAIYGHTPPAVNAIRSPQEWQSYDIIFRRPVVKDGKVVDEGSMTVLVNGVVVQAAVPLDGGGGYYERTSPDKLFPETGPLKLQDHRNAVQYRNIWIRSLRPRPVDGGLDGRLSKEVAMTKRSEIAAEIRGDSEQLQGMAKTLRLLESLAYYFDETAWNQGAERAGDYVSRLEDLSGEQRKAGKKQALSLHEALAFLIEYQRIENVELLDAITEIAVAEGWLKKR